LKLINLQRGQYKDIIRCSRAGAAKRIVKEGVVK